MTAFEDMRLVVLGFGYSAAAFVRAIGPGHCTGTTRSSQKAEALRAQGIHAVVDDGNGRRELAQAIHGATHVLVSAAPGADGDPYLEAFAADFAKARDLTWIGYLSTVGVYGNHDGALIDEDAARRATSQRGVWRIAAENAWWALGERIDVPVGVFRLAGIYGPGRNQFVSLREGRAKRLVKPGQVFNRIHVDDIAATLAASVARPAMRAYNVSDDEPAPPQDVVAFAAELMDVEPPPETPFHEATLSPMARSFYGDVKRISNERIRSELGVKLRYPTYREGLRALWQDGTWQRASGDPKPV